MTEYDEQLQCFYLTPQEPVQGMCTQQGWLKGRILPGISESVIESMSDNPDLKVRLPKSMTPSSTILLFPGEEHDFYKISQLDGLQWGHYNSTTSKKDSHDGVSFVVHTKHYRCVDKWSWHSSKNKALGKVTTYKTLQKKIYFESKHSIFMVQYLDLTPLQTPTLPKDQLPMPESLVDVAAIDVNSLEETEDDLYSFICDPDTLPTIVEFDKSDDTAMLYEFSLDNNGQLQLLQDVIPVQTAEEVPPQIQNLVDQPHPLPKLSNSGPHVSEGSNLLLSKHVEQPHDEKNNEEPIEEVITLPLDTKVAKMELPVLGTSSLSNNSPTTLKFLICPYCSVQLDDPLKMHKHLNTAHNRQPSAMPSNTFHQNSYRQQSNERSTRNEMQKLLVYRQVGVFCDKCNHCTTLGKNLLQNLPLLSDLFANLNRKQRKCELRKFQSQQKKKCVRCYHCSSLLL